MRSLPMKIARVNLNEDSWDATGDVRLYLRSKFAEIEKRLPPSIPRPWPSEEVIQKLVQKAGGTFIYASTVLKYVEDPDSLPTTKLEHILGLTPGPRPFAELDKLYEHILMACPTQHRSTLLHIVGFIFLRNPAFEEAYDVSLIEAILELSPGEVTVVLRRMHSILTITTKDSKQTIHFLHVSFGDFLFNHRRAGCFYIDRRQENLFLATKCIKYLGYCTKRGFDSSFVGNTYTLYAWNSWPYHAAASDSLSPADFLVELFQWDKNLWADIVFPEAYHHSCMDGLEDGISWLQKLDNKAAVDTLISGLMYMGQRLQQKHHKVVLAGMKTPPTIFRVFDDPGVKFFGHLQEIYVVVLERHDKPPEALFFKCHDRVYDFRQAPNPGVETSTEFLRPYSEGELSQHCFLAMHCIRELKGGHFPFNMGGRSEYSVRHWAKHLSLSDVTGEILKELSETRLGPTTHGVKPQDVELVVQWLEKVLSPHEQPELISSWKSDLQILKSVPRGPVPYLGLCDARSSPNRERRKMGIKGPRFKGPP